MEKQESEVSNATPTTSEIEKLLGQATPRPWKWWDKKSGRPKTYDLAKLISGKSDQDHNGSVILTVYGGEGNEALGTSKRDQANAQLIVLAVNALPKLLEFVELVREFLGKGESVDTKPNEQTGLARCPFCRGSANFKNELDSRKLTTSARDEHIEWGVFIECGSCNCIFGQGYMNSQECYEGVFSTLNEAAEAWNHREPGSGVETVADPSDSLREQKLSAIRTALASVDSALKEESNGKD